MKVVLECAFCIEIPRSIFWPFFISEMVTTNTFSDSGLQFDFSAFQLGGSAAFEKGSWIPIARAPRRRTFGTIILSLYRSFAGRRAVCCLFLFFSDAKFCDDGISVSSWPPEC